MLYLKENNNKIQLNFYKNLFPISESSILKILELLEKTEVDFTEFKLYFFRTLLKDEIEDLEIGVKNTNFENKGYTDIFYWYALEKINNFQEFSEEKYFKQLYVSSSTEPPFFKISKISLYDPDFEDKLKEFILNIIVIYNKIDKNTKTKLLEWTIKQIISDLIINFYVFTEIELFPKMIEKSISDNLKFFKINTKTLNSLIISY